MRKFKYMVRVVQKYDLENGRIIWKGDDRKFRVCRAGGLTPVRTFRTYAEATLFANSDAFCSR